MLAELPVKSGIRSYGGLQPNGFNVAVSIPMGVWHTVHSLESGTCILEMKNGAYEPLSDVDILK